ncbi:MAG: VCBS repeat-containing protein [Verrucomicrobia bacterium]|nr:VCBS repeat-containing protein [Verrucomicrobiota bacterium]
MTALTILDSSLNFVRRVLFAAWLVCLLAGLLPPAAAAAEATIVWPMGISAYPWIQGGDEARGGIWLSIPVTQGEAAKVRVRSTDRGTAVPGEDFVPIDGVYSVRRLPSGSGEQIPIQLIPDSIPEGQQTIIFEVSAVSPDTLIRNNDGLMETSLLVTVYFLDDDAQSGRAIFSPQPSHTEMVGARPVAPIIADLNRDGRADVMVALEADHAVAVLLGRTNGWFAPAPGSPFPAGKLPFALAVADLDGDDLPDVLAVNRMDNAITFLKGDGQGGLAATGVAMPTGVEPRAVRVSDFNGDTWPDLLVSNYGDGTLSLLLGDGRGGFRESPGSPFLAGKNPWGLAVGDFDQNGTVDFAVALRGDDALRVFLNQKDGSFRSSLLPVGSQPFDVAVADLDRDGNLDLISADTLSEGVTAFRSKGDGAFEKVKTYHAGASFPRMVVPVDLNRDGYPDLAVLNEHSYVGLLTGVGQTGAGQAGTLPGSPLSPPGILSTLAAGDLNGDGSPDLVVCGPDSGLSFWLNRIRGSFVEVEVPPVRESDRIARINIRRTRRIEEPLRLLVSTRDGTAVAGRDYQGVSGELLFLAGETNKVVEVPIIDDDLWSDSRAFAVDLMAPDSPVIVPERTQVTILDDEPEVRVVVRTEPDLMDAVSERNERIRFLVSRTPPNARVAPFEVRYRVEAALESSSRAAVPGVDFEEGSGTLRFEEGVTEQSFEIRLHDNFEVDGSRAFRVVLTGQPEAPDEIWFSARVEIVDNEFAMLRQELAIAPHDHNWGEDDPGLKHVIPLASGKALVWRGNSMLRLNSDGFPDPDIGQGNGQFSLPITLHDLARFRFLELPNQSFCVVGQLGDSPNSLVVLRVGPDGQPDASFGNGTGMLTIPGLEVVDGLSRDVFLSPDTGLILRFLEGGRTRLRRLSPDGQWDPSFQVWSDAEAVVVAPDGTLFVRQQTGEVVRLLQDGRMDPHFTARSDLTLNPSSETGEQWVQNPPQSYDSEGRVYFGSTNGGLVRILKDGSVDQTYRPLLESVPYRWEVLPSGEVVTQPPDFVVRIAPDGTVGSQYPLWEHRLTGWSVLPDGDIYLRLSRCTRSPWVLWESCWPVHDVLLHPDGTETLFPPIAPFLRRTYGPTAVWTAHDENFLVGNPARWWFPQHPSEAGIPSTGIFCVQNSARVTIQRTGSTAFPATVRGRIWKRIGPQWSEASVQAWEAHFLRGDGETSVDLSKWIPGTNWTAGEYLVRMEATEGAELSGFTACRVWVLPEPANPQGDGLAIASVPGTTIDSEALVLVPEEMPWWRIQESPSPGGPWTPAFPLLIGSMEGTHIRVPRPSTNSVRFFKYFP